MKKSFKRILSALLVAVMLFGFVPMSKIAQNALGATEASAMETVPGSFEYLKNYIYKNGKTDSAKKNVYINTLTSAYKLLYNISSDEIRCGAFDVSMTVDGKKVKETCYIAIGNNERYCTARMFATITKGSYSNYIEAEAIIDPATYYLKKPLNYTATCNGVPITLDESSGKSSYDEGISSFVSGFNTYLERNVNISLGNFGFTNIADPIELPDPNKESIVLNYRQGVYFIKTAEEVTGGVPVISDEYKSSDSSVATVDDNGTITAVGRGNAIVTRTVTDTNGKVYTYTADVTVRFTFVQWLIWIFLLGFLWY